MRINTTEVERYLGPDRRNAYSLLHSRGIWEGQRATGSPKRVLNLTRSAYPGRQRHGTYSWSGDIVATWESLRRQVAEGLSLAASGLPYWTTDVGAFFPGKVCPGLDGASFLRGDFDAGAQDLGYRELFLRWFQYATFLPMLRTHGTGTPREIWHYGEPGGRVYETLVRFIRLRKALVPYLYSLAWQVHSEDSTMFRPLAFDLVFPGADGSFVLYEDEGDGWGYEQGADARTELRWDEANGTLTVGRPVRDYPGRPVRRVVRARLVEPGRGWAEASALWLTAEQQRQELRIPLRPSRSSSRRS